VNVADRCGVRAGIEDAAQVHITGGSEGLGRGDLDAIATPLGDGGGLAESPGRAGESPGNPTPGTRVPLSLSEDVDVPWCDPRIATAPASVQIARNARPRPRLTGAPFGNAMCPALRAAASYRLTALASWGSTPIPACENFTPRQHDHRRAERSW
jgi:hypothetical protein